MAYIVGESQHSFEDRAECFVPRFAEQFTPGLKRSKIRCAFVLRDASMWLSQVLNTDISINILP